LLGTHALVAVEDTARLFASFDSVSQLAYQIHAECIVVGVRARHCENFAVEKFVLGLDECCF
jgi:hypothetical protein